MRFSLWILVFVVPNLTSGAVLSVFVGVNEDGSPGPVIRPQIINAQVGDTVQFLFKGGNHTITQSSFSAPCTQIFNTVTQKKGIDSGFIPYVSTSDSVGIFSLSITQVDSPIWLFCAQSGHCKNGMVAAINPKQTGEKTFTAFQNQLATAAEPAYGVTANFTPPSPAVDNGAARLDLNALLFVGWLSLVGWYTL